MLQKKALISALIAGAAILGFSAVASAELTTSDLTGFYVGGNVGLTSLDSDNPFSSGYSHFGAGAQAGYQFNNYFATELGYTYFDFPHPYHEQAVDLVAKAILPINNYFDIYAKGGAAYVDSTYTSPIRPVYGLGVSYNITPNVSADVSWTRIQSNHSMPNADLAGVGLTYHFG